MKTASISLSQINIQNKPRIQNNKFQHLYVEKDNKDDLSFGRDTVHRTPRTTRALASLVLPGLGESFKNEYVKALGFFLSRTALLAAAIVTHNSKSKSFVPIVISLGLLSAFNVINSYKD